MAPLSAPAKRFVLRSAAIYNLVWGASVIAFPHFLFDFAGLARLNHPEIWQCVGMIVGVYGVGYWIAARDPSRHWPMVLVGLMGKILGPLGFLEAIGRGSFNWKFGLTLLTNDLLWWIPFTWILVDIRREQSLNAEVSNAVSSAQKTAARKLP